MIIETDKALNIKTIHTKDDAFTENFGKFCKVGEKFNLGNFLNSDEQYKVGKFLRWYLEGETISFNVLIKDPFDTGQGASIVISRKEVGLKFDFSIKSQSEENVPLKKAFYWDQLINCFDEGVMYFSTEGTINFASLKIPKMLNLSDENNIHFVSESLEGKDIFSLLHIDLINSIQEFISLAKNNRAARFDIIHHTPKMIVELKGYPIYVGNDLDSIALFTIDVTEKVNAQQKLVEVEKTIEEKAHLIALGELAAGIAHEINTPLCALNLSIGKIKRKHQVMSEEDMQKTLDRMLNTTEMVEKIVKNLLSLARSDQNKIYNYEKHDLFSVVNEVVPLLNKRMHEASISFNFEGTRDIDVEIKKIPFQQVILNLVKNSIDALTEADNDDPFIHIVGEELENMVSIKFMDSGNGIQSDIATMMEQPFFSTKQSGKGLGIGLNVCNSIVKSHGGLLKYCGKENTCFEILIPKSQGFLATG